MPLNINWEDENGNVIEEWKEYLLPWNLTLHRDYELFEDTRCLRFIDLNGDTTFNRFQCEVLVTEFEALLKMVKDPEEIRGIESLLKFVNTRIGNIHIYLKFWGD